jgi:hypothetical protein
VERTPIDRVLERLEHLDCRPRRAGRRMQSRCPAHEDRSPSLSITEGHDGRALLHCFTGCSFANIIEALQLTPAMLFPGYEEDDALRAVAPRGRPKPVRSANTETTIEWATIEDWERDRARAQENDGAIDAAAWICELARQANARSDTHALIRALRALGDDGAIARTHPHHALTLIRTLTRDYAYTETATPLAAALDVLDPPIHHQRAAS